jgi:exodeoxyribonuclease VII small subunit
MADKEFSFEKSLAELQKLVEALENGNVGLDESLALFERGVELVRLCNKRIDEAEQRVLTVRVADDGTVETVAFEGERAE